MPESVLMGISAPHTPLREFLRLREWLLRDCSVILPVRWNKAVHEDRMAAPRARVFPAGSEQ
jgi:hypothetical protein